ncbi:MATE family efflux transporter [Mariniplasma anaerobium]|uniref:MATE family efflux transporter n=1 Tax=Mariniplasma anaerobium TaxID=2735436 RepID=A0A7U9TJY5_9MOLU|nr:MATE family efflux transporter [Mariniplasma anaerobium]BCR36279.1 MATE family efflux transporter [Mariniplasma anaerobium]
MSKDEKKQHLILHDKNIFKGLLILSIPLMLNNLIKTFHDVIDMFFVSEIPGYSTEAINSISLTFPVFFAYISLGIGLSAAGTALISQHLGSKQMEKAKKFAANLVMIAIALGVFLNIGAFFLAKPVMELMGTEGYTLENSVKYLQIRAFELPFVFIFFAFTAIRQSSGDTVTPVIYGVITIIINIILSPLLISTFGFGVSGAAIATLIANISVVPFIIYQLFNAKQGVTLDKSILHVDFDIVRKIAKYAVPASLGQSITAIGFIIMNTIILTYGAQTVAAFSVGNRITSIILHPVMAIGGVLAAYLGQNIGNQNPDRAREAFRKAMILSVLLMGIGSFIVIWFRAPLIGIFIKDDPTALNLGVEYMFYLLIGLPLMGIFQTFMGTFNGTGNTKFTFAFSIARLWILRIPAILIFKYTTQIGSSGIWYAMLISNVLIIFVGIFFYNRIDFMPKIDIDRREQRLLKSSV